MKNYVVGAMLLAGLALSMPGWAGFYSSDCEEGSNKPKPGWVNNNDYSEPGYQVGIGQALRGRKSHEEAMAAAESDARKRLVQQIQINVKAEDVQSTRVNGKSVSLDASSKTTASSEEDLRGLKVKNSWVDKETCTYYALVVVSKESLAQTKREKIAKIRMAKFKELLEDGTDERKNRDIKVRRKALVEAQALLADIDFSLLPDELGENIYTKRVDDALTSVNRETAKVKGRMALFAFNEDQSLKADVLGRMLDQLRSGDTPTARLLADCTSQQECLSIAKERGYTMLTFLTASSQVVMSPMGSLKGTLTISRTVYDIESRKALKADKVSTQVIGWDREELDWGTAAEKAMQNFK